MKNRFSKEMQLQEIEKIINNEIFVIKKEYGAGALWGDIELSLDDYEILKMALRNALIIYCNKRNNAINIICFRYPYSVTAFMIFMVKYKYKRDFWGLVEDEIGTKNKQNNQSIIGDCILSTFKKADFNIPEEILNQHKKYLEPVLYEAGLPDSSLDDLFYVLRYDEAHNFDPELIIDDLLGYRSYLIRKPLENFLNRFQKEDRAIDFIIDVHDAMENINQGGEVDSYYSEQYSNWLNEENEDKKIVERRDNQERPRLFFENGRAGLCMILPSSYLSLPANLEWLDRVEWRINYDDGSFKTVAMRAFGDRKGKYIEKTTVQIKISSVYNIDLLAKNENNETVKLIGNGKNDSFKVDGVCNDTMLLFNLEGRFISKKTYLPAGGATLVCSTDMAEAIKRGECTGIEIEEQYYPNCKNDYAVLNLVIAERAAYLQYSFQGREYKWENRPEIKVKLIGERLFSLPETSESNVFVKLPQLYLESFGEEKIDELNLKVDNKLIEVKFSDNKGTIDLQDFKYTVFSTYRVYKMRLYHRKHYLKEIEFVYAPKIETDYKSNLEWDWQGKTYIFKRLPEWKMTFSTNCITNERETAYEVVCPPGVGEFEITCSKILQESKEFSFSVTLPIKPFELVIIENNLNDQAEARKVRKIGLQEVISSEYDYWLRLKAFNEYKNCNYLVKLVADDEVKQEEKLKLSGYGLGQMKIGVFFDTLQICPLPARLELCCDGDSNKILSVLKITDNVSLPRRPVYDKNNGTIKLDELTEDVVLRRFGLKKTELVLKANEYDRLVHGYNCGELENGLYVIEKQQDLSFLEENGEVIPSVDNNTLYIGGEKCELSAWLGGVFAGLFSEKSAAVNIEQLKKINISALDDNAYEYLIALAYYVQEEAKIEKKKKAEIKEYMRCLSEYALTGKSRTEIIRCLVQMECSENVIKSCIEIYNLYIADMSIDNALCIAYKLEENTKSEEIYTLTLLILLRNGVAIKDIMAQSHYRTLLGGDAVKALLTVPEEKEPNTIREEQLKFIKELSPCRVKIELTSAISGKNEKAWILALDHDPKLKKYLKSQKMYALLIAQEQNNNKTREDVYFAGMRYSDQIENWYLTIGKKQNEEKWLKLILDSKKDEIGIIIEKLKKRDDFLGEITKCYADVLQERVGGQNSTNYDRYFYLEGLASFLLMLPEKYKREVSDADIRLVEMFLGGKVLARKMMLRDFLMASVYIFFKRKEEKLCR